MKVLDLLRDNRELMALMAMYDLSPTDAEYLPVMEEYETMKQRGFKVTFAVEYLASKHKVSTATLYRVIKRLNTPITR